MPAAHDATAAHRQRDGASDSVARTKHHSVSKKNNPISDSAVSVRPAPTRPANPRISPSLTVKETSAKAPGELSPRTSRTTGPVAFLFGG